MSSQSLLGPASGSPRLSTIGFEKWPSNAIDPHKSSLGGLSTDRGQAEALRLPMNFLTQLLLGLEIQIRGLERRGKRALGFTVGNGRRGAKS